MPTFLSFHDNTSIIVRARMPSTATLDLLQNSDRLRKGMMSIDELSVESVDSSPYPAAPVTTESTTNAAPAQQAKQASFKSSSNKSTTMMSDEAPQPPTQASTPPPPSSSKTSPKRPPSTLGTTPLEYTASPSPTCLPPIATLARKPKTMPSSTLPR